MCLNIGLLGLSFHSGNLGCSALAYSFMDILNKVVEKKQITACVKIILPSDDKRMLKVDYKNITYEFVRMGIINKTYRANTLDAIAECDLIFDFTAGDSFSDIYGMRRFIKHTVVKEFVLLKGKQLILGNQTYGPYKHLISKIFAGYIIRKSKDVFARDVISKKVAEHISGRNVILSTDVAFFLPYEKKPFDNDKINVGINVSGLLWNGGYTKDNQFNLTVNYQHYTNSVIKTLLMDKRYKVHLIPHVVYTSDHSVIDNDWFVSMELHDKYAETVLAPAFETPIAAKSYISSMDVFIGARMHATIAAYSSGVPVVAFSYSRKFEGLYDSINYPYVISGIASTDQQAIEKTLTWIDKREELSSAISNYSEELLKIKKQFTGKLNSLIFNSVS